ncbi:Do family serine endopeptidase [Terrihabitans soli]|nr:Do family serine endopeptidase [Terrihabitans soli]
MQPETPVRPLKNRKKVLLASAVALGLTGVLAGEAYFANTQPANAQIVQAQDLSKNNQLSNNAPRQDQIGFADVVETVKPAVVSVRVKTATEVSSNENELPGMFKDLPEGHPFRRFFEEYGMMPDGGRGDRGEKGGRKGSPRQFGQAQGSGFFISADGYVVTNNHVVTDAEEVELVTDSGETLPAKVVGTDPQTDLALLKVDAKEKFPFVSLGKDVPRIGDWVVAIGNPFGLGGTVTAGIVSARGRDLGSGPYDDFLQIDAAVNRGNSGGPTFNLKGEVVGVNTAIYSQSGGNVGIAFAVPANVVANVVDSLRQSGSVTRGWLGVGIQPVEEDMAEAIGLKGTDGALVSEVHSSTPAFKAGIKNQDVILSLNGQKVADPRELTRMVGALKPGSDAKLKVWRDGAEKDVTVELGKRPDDVAKLGQGEESAPADTAKPTPSTLDDLGLKLEPSKDGAGVAVAEVDSDGALSDKLNVGDIILEVSGTSVSSPADVAKAVEDVRKKGSPRFMTLRVKRGEGTRYVAIPVQKG